MMSTVIQIPQQLTTAPTQTPAHLSSIMSHNFLRPLLCLQWLMATPSYLCLKCPIPRGPSSPCPQLSLLLESLPCLPISCVSPQPPTGFPAANTPHIVCLLTHLPPSLNYGSLRTGAELLIFMSLVLSKVLEHDRGQLLLSDALSRVIVPESFII